MPNAPFLEVVNVSKTFDGVHALNGVSLEVAPGEIHCLAGENGSGKSTLIKTIAGVHAPDSGYVSIGGHQHDRLQPIDAIRAGIQVIYQDFSLFPNLSVAENIAMNQLLSERRTLVSWPSVRRIAKDALAKIGVKLDLKARVEELPVADKQLVAISRALLHDAKLIIMDEPTSALTEREVVALLGIIKELQRQGVAVLFVSHKLSELFEVSERFTVLRNGKRVAAGDASEFDLETLTYHMTGRKLTRKARGEFAPTGKSLLRVEGLGKRGQFRDVTFAVEPGEVLGITGVLGSGRTALAQTLFGLTRADEGQVFIDGHEAKLTSVQDAIAEGVGYVPEDRLTEGLFLPQSIAKNVVVGKIDALLGGGGLVDRRSVDREVDDWVKKLSIATPSATLPVMSLSGGNQQRVVLARWLALSPRILILNGPTVGVDVGSKADIHDIIGQLAADGIGVLVISDDLPELLSTCDRLLIMKAGRVAEVLDDLRMTERELSDKLTSRSVTA